VNICSKKVFYPGTSADAQVGEGKPSRSDAEMVSKIEGGLQELKETV
jgi:hypothetical protein